VTSIDEQVPASFDPSTRMRRQARLMAAANIVMRRLLMLPFATPLSRRLMLLTVTGRRTGKVYRQPISYVRSGEILLTPGGGRWTLNLDSDRPVSLRIRGKDRPAIATVIDEPSEVERLLTIVVTGNPAAARFMPIPVNAGRPDVNALKVAIRHGFRVISWRLCDASLTRSVNGSAAEQPVTGIAEAGNDVGPLVQPIVNRRHHQRHPIVREHRLHPGDALGSG
jgi:hypothetical protein